MKYELVTDGHLWALKRRAAYKSLFITKKGPAEYLCVSKAGSVYWISTPDAPCWMDEEEAKKWLRRLLA